MLVTIVASLSAAHASGRGVSGQFWDVEIYRNGNFLNMVARRTRGSDGYFWIERELRNLAGVDVFEVIATNRVTGEVCEGYLEWPH